MKPRLMDRDRDFDAQQALPWNERALVQDLSLETLLEAMARGDEFIEGIARRALLTSFSQSEETILYRQATLRDALESPVVVRDLYRLTIDALEARRKGWWGIWSHTSSSVLSGAIETLEMQIGMLRRLRGIASAHAASFSSEAFRTFFAMLARELTDEYLARIQTHLTELRFRRGVLISAELGEGGAGRDYVLRKPNKDGRNWLRRLFANGPAYTFSIDPRDEAGGRALADIRDRGLNLAANALAQSADHINAFFPLLRAEVAFYVGCINLHERLSALGAQTCFPRALPTGARRLGVRELYDPCLALQMQRVVVGNTIGADGKSLVIITGANQGGKSSFLRSVGVAQLMMQTGMFVAAESLDGELCGGLVTHYKREEDATLKSGKFDEELARMSEIVEHLTPSSLVLFNESFAATNEREGSEIARQVTSALLEQGMKVFFVTHLHAFARGFFERKPEECLFLRAERRPDGTRTFRLVEAEPLATSHGRDLYERIFGGRRT